MNIEDLRDQMPGGQNTRDVSDITNLVRHHSATEEGDALNFARYHTEQLGWETSGYHEVILKDGTVQLCYDPEVITNGVGNHNGYTYHICLVGAGEFTDAQEEAFRERIFSNLDRFSLEVEQVLGHNEFSGHESIECPGRDMDQVRSELENHRNHSTSNNSNGDDDKLDLLDWQWELIEENLEKMYEEDILNSDQWLEKARNRELTISELAFLNNVILIRLN